MVTSTNDHLRAFINPNAALLFCLVLMVFFVPMLPVSYHYLAYNLLFSFIFLLSALSLQHHRRKMLTIFALILIVIIWIAFQIDLLVVFLVSRIAQGLFFLFVVIRLIKQTATAKNVNVRVIADSINGYLLVGIIYSIVVYSVLRLQPDAYNFAEGNNHDGQLLSSKMIYYTFVTYTSTGYGDIAPILPGARSLATLISATGQLYVAIIIALLVGKFSSLKTKDTPA